MVRGLNFQCDPLMLMRVTAGSAFLVAIRWNDPQIGIQWPVTDPVVSEKDQKSLSLADWLQSAESRYFTYQPRSDAELSLRS
jgi:dTDP-4-dehydrorhamnose 3,5-epimerase-like enzyme